jgi:predicted nucleic acid-binding Zn ribbon protein
VTDNVKNLSIGLDSAIKDLGLPKSEALEAIFNKWEIIVGDKIAQFCKPNHFKDGVLYLKCADYTWFSQFKFYKKPIENAIQNKLQLKVPIEVQIMNVKGY